MRKFGIIFLLGFAIALAAVIGVRMSTEAMSVAIGVVFGVAAGIPTSLLLTASARRQPEPAPTSREADTSWERRRELPRELPPVIVVNPGGQQQHFPPSGYGGYSGYQVQWPLAPAFAAPNPRQVHYVGGESDGNEE